MPWLAAAGAIAGSAAQLSQGMKKNYDASRPEQYNSQLPSANVASILSGVSGGALPFPSGSAGAPGPSTSLGSARDYSLMHNLSQLNSGNKE